MLEGSLDSQRHRLVSFVDLKNVQESNWGKVIDYYVDEGFSAKDTKRPALQRLLKDLRAGKVNLILVTDLSRLSRNILDFCLLLEDLRKHNGKFLSVKEQFDTTTAAGEMMVFNMINLAQFERKQTAERVSQNFHSRALRGLLNGGPVILGYDKKPENPSHYIVNQTEAPIVREIFRIFLEEGSLGRTAQKLNDSKIPRKLGIDRQFRLASEGIWTPISVKNLIQNKAYIGIREVNKKYKHKVQNSLKPWQQHKDSKAVWPAIVTNEIFENAQNILAAARTLERPGKTHPKGSPFILTGVLKCNECNAPFVGETAHGRMSSHRYYGHKQYQKIPFKCSVRRFSADAAEEAVENHLSAIALNPKELDRIEIVLAEERHENTDDLRVEKERVQTRLFEINKETQRAFKFLGEMPDGDGLDLIKEKLEELGSEKKKQKARLSDLEDRLSSSVETHKAREVLECRLLEFKGGWKKGSFSEKKRLIRAFFERLDVTTTGLAVRYLVDPENAEKDIASPGRKNQPGSQKENVRIADFQNKKPAGTFVFPAGLGSYDVKIGVTDGA